MLYHMSVFTGPTIVNTMAAKFEEAGIKVVCIGTEHILFEIRAERLTDAIFETLERLRNKYDSTFGLEVANFGGFTAP